MFKNFVILIAAALLIVRCSSISEEMYPNRPLIQAITDHGDLKKVEDAVSKGANVNESDARSSISALQFAEHNIYKKENHPGERLATVRFLIEKGANVNHEDGYGRTVFADLMNDTKFSEDNYKDADKVSLAKLMLQSGLDLKMRQSSTGDTPLHFLVENALQHDRYSEVITLLLKAGADPDFKNISGESPRSMIDKKANNELKEQFYKHLKGK